MMKVMKIGVLAIALFCLATMTVLADERKEINKYIDEFPYIALQIDAVSTDMSLYLGWLFEEKGQMAEAAKKAIARLDEIRDYLISLDLPEELHLLRDAQVKIIDRYKEIYSGIEKKKTKEIDNEFNSLDKLNGKYIEELKRVVEKIEYTKRFPGKNFKVIDEEISLIQDRQDKKIYLNAVELIKDKKYQRAYEILTGLRKKYKNTSFEYCIMYRISDCLLMEDSNLEVDDKDSRETGIELLSNILDSNVYLPILYYVFLKWRTMEQSYNYGMSNYSEIPNEMYNRKRWHIVQLIKEYLHSNPDDKWAQTQIFLLLDLPNINRGTPYGNTNLLYWGKLYTDIGDKDIQKNK